MWSDLPEGMQIQASPNPSPSGFRVVVNSSNVNERIKLIVTDVLGRVVETRITNAGQPTTFGFHAAPALKLVHKFN